MASGFKSRKKSGEYVFVNGRAVRASEVSSYEEEVVPAPGQDKKTAVESLRKMQEEDAFELTPEAKAGAAPIARTPEIMVEERSRMRTKYVFFGGVLVVLVIFSLCFSSTLVGTFYTPLDVINSVGAWFRLTYTQIFQSNLYQSVYREVNASMPYYADCMLQIWLVFKYVACGALLAISGMLYQNTFRNPIAAPSMLGVSNGINFALLILVLQYGYAATQYFNLYYIYSIIGGLGILLLVMLGGKWISGKGRFNTVNMILMGTIISQLLGIIITYAQASLMDDSTWEAYYMLQGATGVQGPWAYGTLIVGGLAALVPVVLFRFKLNLISFSDEDARMLGVNPTKLRLVALGCGSLMILVGQLNAGQIAMMSLIVPFIVRTVFGSEFRKQLAGNLLMGAIIMLLCFIIGTFVQFDGLSVGAAQIVSIVAIPLFVWILAIRQKSWE